MDIRDIEKKGFIAEHVVMIDLVKNGYIPCSPEIASSPFDMVAVRGNKSIKVQVKSFTFKGENSCKLTIKRPSAKSGKYINEDYDILALVESDEMKIAYFPFMDKYQVTMYKTKPDKLTGARNRNIINLFYDNLDFNAAVNKLEEAS